MSFLSFSEAATSRGFLMGMTTRGSAPVFVTALIQNSISRQKLRILDDE